MNKKIVISTKDHKLFYFCQSENAVFLTPEEGRAEQFNSYEEAMDTFIKCIYPYNRFIHEYDDTELSSNLKEELEVWEYEYTTTWKLLDGRIFNDE